MSRRNLDVVERAPTTPNPGTTSIAEVKFNLRYPGAPQPSRLPKTDCSAAACASETSCRSSQWEHQRMSGRIRRRALISSGSSCAISGSDRERVTIPRP